MASVSDTVNFNRPDRFLEGWYWVVPGSELRRGQVKPVVICGRNLAVYRGEDGVAQVIDAYCPHMGAHFGEGIVEGTGIRCFFHNWKFERDGRCSDVPSLGKALDRACIKTWPTEERYGMVWVWTGDEVTAPIPHPPELEGLETHHAHGGSWVKGCHPNVVMVNAIDAHHFNTVHNLPIDVVFEKSVNEHGGICFANQTRGGEDSLFVKLIRPFYKGRVTYDLCYWFGSTGTVTVGPDWLHFYIMFSIRPTPDGKAEGRTMMLTQKRPGILGWLYTRVLLVASWCVGAYFAVGDTQIFESIRFDFKTPVKPDYSIIEFIKYCDTQKARALETWEELPLPPTRPMAVPDDADGDGDAAAA
jgi:phenylpropionate dioxygenase-like ring-hydroxylating dioxygenase large terminal subunit